MQYRLFGHSIPAVSGQKKYSEMKTAVWTTLIASAVLVAVLMLVGFLLGETAGTY